MTVFRPCIDLHQGKVKQIVGGTLRDNGAGLRTNFESDRPASYYAEMYRRDGLAGGHVIQLGPHNLEAALGALHAYPGGLHIGGGITPHNAEHFLDAGASHVIVTSCLFEGGRFSAERLREMTAAVGRHRLVIDLSCRAASDGGWVVATNRWQTLTDLRVDAKTLDRLAAHCDEFLIHAVDVEGRQQGIDEALVSLLGGWGGKPVTYAGGAHEVADLQRVETLSGGKVDLSIGSALDIFGGRLIRYADCVAFNRKRSGT